MAAASNGEELGASLGEGLDPPVLGANSEVGDLVLSYLEAIQEGLQAIEPVASDSPGPGTAELAYGLDQTVSSYLEQQGLPLDHYHDIQQELINGLADVMEERGITEHGSIGVDEFGNADGIDVLGVLDGHLHDLLDMMPSLELGSTYDHPGGLDAYGTPLDS
ncbi:MAG: hypothetical protein VKJ66_10355 [Synechococcus sp.]|nr:hypothetical protein [Synechococcus sp.]